MPDSSPSLLGFCFDFFAGVVLLSINNHCGRSCSYRPCTELSWAWAALGVSWVFWEIIAQKPAFVMLRKGEERVSWESGTAGAPSAFGAAIGALRGLPNAGRGYWELFAASQDSLLGEAPHGCPICTLSHQSCADFDPPLLPASQETSHCGAVSPGRRPAECICCTICIIQHQCFPTAARKP